jgi:serine/threonine-protein kinase RsbW
MQVALLRKDLRGWLIAHGVDAESCQAVLLATSEAAGNAVEHGYRDNPLGLVEVTAVISEDAIEVQVIDRGAWLEPRGEASRGRGLRLIRQVMDKVEIEHGTGGTTVYMRRMRKVVR